MDAVVYDMCNQTEAAPQVFVKKDWLDILDNQNQSYQGNQSVIDTSQLSNSNKYINYREGYLSVPLLITATAPASATAANNLRPATAATSCDYIFGLKNWYGSIVHSLTLDMNGTTIIQQTPYAGMWSCFKLMTSLSINDVKTQGSAIGFHPDTALSVAYSSANRVEAPDNHTFNNNVVGAFDVVGGADNSFSSYNEGLLRRTQAWNFNRAGLSAGANSDTFGDFISADNLNLLFKSYIFNKLDGDTSDPGVFQVAITAIIKLKHLHEFFDKICLAKGLFLKLTLNLNQSSVQITNTSGSVRSSVVVNSPLGGVSPIMVSSNGTAGTLPDVGTTTISVSVGRTCLNSSQTGLGSRVQSSPLSGSIILNVPAYSFSTSFETAYLQSPIKKIDYSDIYQYQVVNSIAAGATFTQLISNGISGVKSVLCLPFYSSASNGGVQPIQSPFDPAGAGPTSPLCHLTQFNVQLSGQNQIYNTQRYVHSQFLNQLYGYGATNGGQTDGLTSGLVSKDDFEMCYNYYYVNCERGLPIEMDVPKSVNVLGTNTSTRAIDLFIFVEYHASVSIDILTGSRV
jgi:hypothetical protein